MLMLTMIFAVLAAAVSFLMETQKNGQDPVALFIIAILVAPMGLMVVVSVVLHILNSINDNR